jgi:hypothetical protein
MAGLARFARIIYSPAKPDPAIHAFSARSAKKEEVIHRWPQMTADNVSASLTLICVNLRNLRISLFHHEDTKEEKRHEGNRGKASFVVLRVFAPSW